MNILDEVTSEVFERYHKKTGRPLLVAIDGHGGSGKSTLVNKLKNSLEGIPVTIIPVDAFIITEPLSAWKTLKDYPNAKTPYKIDIDRLKKEVLKPLSEGKSSTYLFHKDWWNKKAQENRTIAPDGIVIIEGCYSLSKELRDYYDYKVFLDCPLDICLKRVSQRDISLGGDTVTAPLLWQEIYFPAEIQYMNEEKPKSTADIVINTANIVEELSTKESRE